MSESPLQSAILQILRYERRCKVMRNNVGFVSRKGFKFRYGLGNGSADIICCIEGMFLAMECKDESEQSEPQIKWQREIEAAGGIYVVVRTVPEARAAVARARMQRRVA